MVFSGIVFLYRFLPVVLLLYFLVPKIAKNAVLLLASLFFYAWGEQRLVIMLLLGITIGYVFGLIIEKLGDGPGAKVALCVLIILNLGMLGYFKYADFFIENINRAFGLSVELLHIVLPIGISFYTFQILSYGVDVYRKEVAAERNFIDFATYVSFFPQLIAGPIVRYSDISGQLKNRAHSISMVGAGIRRFSIGLGKKVLIANTMAGLCAAFREADTGDVLFYWLYGAAFMLQIYFDFSGYSDMAIGLGGIFGFTIRENFSYPYAAKTITDFWRRWHMSLGSWFRDYVYIPLGGSRCGVARQIINILVVWMLTGFWHGAAWNFVLWGLFYAILLGIEKFIIKEERLKAIPVVGHVYVVLLVMLGFVLFNGADLSQAWGDITGMFGAGGGPVVSNVSIYYLASYGPILLAAIIGCTSLPARFVQKIEHIKNARVILPVLEVLYVATLLILSTAFLVSGSFNPFLYFRF